MALDEIKRVFSSVFPRDIRTVEPSKKGLIFGEVLRVYEEKNGPVLAFLEGTDRNTRKQYTDKLDTSNVKYTVGKDFSL